MWTAFVCLFLLRTLSVQPHLKHLLFVFLLMCTLSVWTLMCATSLLGCAFGGPRTSTHIENQEPLIGGVKVHGLIGHVVLLNVHLHLQLFEVEQQLELLRVVLPAQSTFQHWPAGGAFKRDASEYLFEMTQYIQRVISANVPCLLH